MIEGTYSGGIGIAVMAIAYSKVGLVVRIIVQWVESRQSVASGSGFVDTAAQFSYPAIQVADALGVLVYFSLHIFQLSIVYCICFLCPSRYMSNLLLPCVEYHL